MMLIAKLNVNPSVPVEMIVKVPAIVNVRTSITREDALRVTVIPAGMRMEHSPTGTTPPIHVAGLSNDPDTTASN